MPELKEQEAIVTSARFDSTDRTSADFKRQLNRYMYENLPLTAEQKLEFRSLFRANASGDVNGVCHSSVDEDE
jgi:hypothetical protein